MVIGIFEVRVVWGRGTKVTRGRMNIRMNILQRTEGSIVCRGASRGFLMRQGIQIPRGQTMIRRIMTDGRSHENAREQDKEQRRSKTKAEGSQQKQKGS